MALCVGICHFILRTMTEATCIQLLELKVMKVSPCHCHEGIQGEKKYSLALGGDGWWTSHPSCFTPKERIHNTHSIGVWVGRRADLDISEKRIISCRYWELNLRLSSLVTVMIIPPWSLFQWQVTDRYWQQGLQDSMKKKSPLCVNLGTKRLYYLHVAGNGQNCTFLILYHS